MDRELLLEIGCEELPASWLPGLTAQIGEVMVAQLNAQRLAAGGAGRNLQHAAAADRPDRPTLRAADRSRRAGQRSAGLGRASSPTARRRRRRSASPPRTAPRCRRSSGSRRRRASISRFARSSAARRRWTCCRTCWAATLRGLTFPKLMHWDAMLDDGRGDLLFGRPIRWLLFIYGGRVVPFTIARTPAAAERARCRTSRRAPSTYGHRFLTTSGRAGRAIKVRSFDEYRARLLENFVVLERSERHDKIARELDAKAQRLQGRVSRAVARESGLLQEVPDLVEYPVGRRRHLRDRVPRTARGSADDDADSSSALFPGRRRGRAAEERVPRGHQHRAGQRTHDRAQRRARGHRAAARRALFLGGGSQGPARVAARAARHAAVSQEARAATARRPSASSGWRGASPRSISAPPIEMADYAAQAARLSKADLDDRHGARVHRAPGHAWAASTRAKKGLPEEVWKAIYYHYLPIGVDADAPPSRAQLGKAAVTWAAVSLADKLDTIVGLFAAGEKPTGSAIRMGCAGRLRAW